MFEGFFRGPRWNLQANCFPFLSLYCCDIPEEEVMKVMQHRTAEQRLCIRRVSSMTDFRALRGEKA